MTEGGGRASAAKQNALEGPSRAFGRGDEAISFVGRDRIVGAIPAGGGPPTAKVLWQGEALSWTGKPDGPAQLPALPKIGCFRWIATARVAGLAMT